MSNPLFLANNLTAIFDIQTQDDADGKACIARSNVHGDVLTLLNEQTIHSGAYIYDTITTDRLAEKPDALVYPEDGDTIEKTLDIVYETSCQPGQLPLDTFCGADQMPTTADEYATSLEELTTALSLDNKNTTNKDIEIAMRDEVSPIEFLKSKHGIDEAKDPILK